MWMFKRCPRCQGDIYIDENGKKRYQQCLQCGYENELDKLLAKPFRRTEKSTIK